MAKAKETSDKIDEELKDLQATLANIEDARPFEDLTVRLCLPDRELNVIICSQTDEVGAAHPRILEAVETMVKNGKWTVPGA